MKKHELIRKLILLAGCGMAMGALACNNYLDVKSNSALVTPNTLESLQRLLDAGHHMNFAVNAYAEASSDNYFLTPDTYNSMAELDRLVYTWQNVDQIWDNDWAKGYVPVYNANLALSQLEKISRTDENAIQWDNVKGSSLFFRAHQFLTLVWTYAKAYDVLTAQSNYGVVLRTDPDPSKPSTRASLEATYRQITDDLKASLSYLPIRASHPMRPSVPAAYGMLARTYLSMAKFDSAYVYADHALRIHSELMDYNDSQQVNATAALPFQRFNRETIFYAQLANTQPNIHPNFGLIDSLLYRSYADDDLRKTAFFSAKPSGYASFKGSYAGSTDFFAGLATDELFLIRAECAARMDRVEEAMEDLNTLLSTRWKTQSFEPFVAENREKALYLILSERRKELLMRGLRWIDIKRLNVESGNISVKRIVDGKEINLIPNDNKFALPIPSDVIRATGMPQNEY